MRTKDPMMDIFTHQWKVMLPPLLSKRRKLPKPPPEAILMCKTAVDSLKAVTRQEESTHSFLPQISGIKIIAIPDEVALRIPPLGLEHMVVGKLKDIYALLEEYDAMPGKEPK